MPGAGSTLLSVVMGVVVRGLIASALAVVVLAGQVPPAHAQVFRMIERVEVVEGLVHEVFSVVLDDGSLTRGSMLRFRQGQDGVELRAVLAGDKVAGLETTTSMAAREREDGAVAGVNGGFWLPRPTGAPNGLYVQDGELVAGEAVTKSGDPRPRGAFGVNAAGQFVFDRLHVLTTLRRPDGEVVALDEVNRLPLPEEEPSVGGQLSYYDSSFGTSIPADEGSRFLVVSGLSLGSSGDFTGTVERVRDVAGTEALAVPADSALLVASGAATERLDGIVAGEEVTVTVTPVPYATEAARWADLRTAMPGGPLLVRDGSLLPQSGWKDEALSDDHLVGRHPRTAIALTGDGQVLLVTVDGRLPAWSAGMRMWELARFLLDRGAVQALSLDGGGSTTMTVAGELANHPSDGFIRSVNSGLFVYYSPPVDVGARDTSAYACPAGQVPQAAFLDIAGDAHEANIACLVWYGITAGRTPTSYDPAQTVTREQMASFLARMLDQAATRGGRALPEAGAPRFVDVAEGSVHADSVGRLAAAGIVAGGAAGLPDTFYAPDLAVTRAQMASFVSRAYAYSAGRDLPAGANVFADDTGSVHEANINRLAAAGIVHGRMIGYYDPAATVKRASMASFVMRTVDLLAERGVTSPPG